MTSRVLGPMQTSIMSMWFKGRVALDEQEQGSLAGEDRCMQISDVLIKENCRGSERLYFL